jgi:hypothetical protein
MKREIGGAGTLHAFILIENCHHEKQNFEIYRQCAGAPSPLAQSAAVGNFVGDSNSNLELSHFQRSH